MPRTSSVPPRSVAPSYRDWKAEASKQLQHRHDIPAAAIPEHEWARLFKRHFSPEEAAERAKRVSQREAARVGETKTMTADLDHPWLYRAVTLQDNLHTVSLYQGNLCVRCRRCNHRAALGADVLPILRGDMTPVDWLRLKCSRCGGPDLERWLSLTPQAVDAFRAY